MKITTTTKRLHWLHPAFALILMGSVVSVSWAMWAMAPAVPLETLIATAFPKQAKLSRYNHSA